MSLKQKTLVIVNPKAGGGLASRLWPRASRELRKKIGPFDFEETTAIGHARILAADAADAGYRLVVSYGGDGTIHEVINGLHDAKDSSKTALGIISVGTGSDLIKSLRIPAELSDQIKIVAGEKVQKIDLGRVSYLNHEGRQERRVFINITDAGLGAEVLRRLQRSRTFFGRRLAYLSATLVSYFAWGAKKIRITTDHPHDAAHPNRFPEKILAVVVANGQYFGGGMPIAPSSSLTDGYLDVVVVGDMDPFLTTLAIPMLYSKQLVRLPNVVTDRVRSLILTSEERVDLDIDGEPIGSLPATFEILPAALKVKVR